MCFTVYAITFLYRDPLQNCGPLKDRVSPFLEIVIKECFQCLSLANQRRSDPVPTYENWWEFERTASVSIKKCRSSPFSVIVYVCLYLQRLGCWWGTARLGLKSQGPSVWACQCGESLASLQPLAALNRRSPCLAVPGACSRRRCLPWDIVKLPTQKSVGSHFGHTQQWPPYLERCLFQVKFWWSRP